ncbi:MAG TPA: AAA family ATPase [Armatimonadota bacterium]|nr:AAA family ATPase [Planctomycetota bacterium]HUV03888.1 AAA family ATPase [Armatimonadota bacterium]
MEGKRLIRSIRLQNILSFGPDGVDIELQPLNVLIGPNGSGKSNVIECLNVLHMAPESSIAEPIRESGGIDEWIWRGEPHASKGEVEAVLEHNDHGALRYRIALRSERQQTGIAQEIVEDANPPDGRAPECYCRRNGNEADVLTQIRTTEPSATRRERKIEWCQAEQSILNHCRSWDYYPEITLVGDRFRRMAFYRKWNLGPGSPVRMPQRADLPNDFLLEDARNLGLVINELIGMGMGEMLAKRMKDVHLDIERIHTRTAGGTVMVCIDEGLRGLTPAMRLSDGTLRYLCLLAILCHPQPPPLICIEEPELGFHPDVHRHLGELLIAASQRTQLLVTTHSDVLISALTDVPESVLVCTRFPDRSSMQRLKKEDLAFWLEKYTLGEVWMMGAIGGNP